MSTTFDFANIENLIIAKLRADLDYVQSVETYAGQLQDAVEGRTAKFPMLTVSYASGDMERIDGPNLLATDEFEVGIFAHSLRGETDIRTNAVSGAYRMIRDVKDSLVNARLAEGLQQLEPLRVDLVFVTSTMAIYSFRVRVQHDQAYQWPA